MGVTGSSLKGGCGVYINSDLNYHVRKDLEIKIKTHECEIETFWIELIIDKQPNRLIGIVYRHPKKKDILSTENLQDAINKIKKERKIP